MKQRLFDSVIFPLLGVVTIAILAGGLGVIFMVLEASSLHVWGPIILGIILTIGVPTVAAILDSKVD